MFQKIKIKDHITAYIRPTKQFKTVTFLAQWQSEYTGEKAANRAVLSNVLQEATERYPSYRQLKKEFDLLYGTSMFTDVQMKGNIHRFQLMSETIHENFAEPGHFDAWWRLMEEMVMRPLVKEGQFDEKIVRREKRSIIERKEAVYEYKSRFARKRLLEWMRPDDPASASRYGTIQQVEDVTATSLYREYTRMLQQDELIFYIVGDVDIQEVKRRLLQHFNLNPQVEEIPAYTCTSQPKAHYVREQQSMQQGQLQIGYRLPIYYGDDDFFVMQVANGLFGGFSHSKLFQNVREKESMAYSISSGYSSQYGLLLVGAGIEATEEAKAVQLIEEQLDAVQRGAITFKELEKTKKQLTNSLKNAFDTARGQIMLYEQFEPLFENVTVAQIAQKWEEVTIADVQRVMRQANREVVYLLSAKEEVVQ